MKIKSPKLTAICMARRDELKQKAAETRANAEKAFEQAELQARNLLHTAKTVVHAARICANRMEKEADLIQEALAEELEMQVKQEQEADKAWEVKSKAELAATLKAELESSDDVLIELMKKVN